MEVSMNMNMNMNMRQLKTSFGADDAHVSEEG
jgi:hypothetical protein